MIRHCSGCLGVGSVSGILAMISFCSCIRDIEFETIHTPTVVVECLLTDEPEQTLRLGFTRNSSDEKYEQIDGAVVSLTDLTEGSVVGKFHKSETDSLWRLSYSGVPGHRYRLDVGIPGHEDVWAEDIMPERVKVECRWRTHEPYFNEYYNGELLEDYFHSKGYVRGTYYRILSENSNVWIYGGGYEAGSNRFIASSAICSDYAKVDQLNVTQHCYDGGLSDSQTFTIDVFQSSQSIHRYDKLGRIYDSMFQFKQYVGKRRRDTAGLLLHDRYLRLAKEDTPTGFFAVYGDFEGDYFPYPESGLYYFTDYMPDLSFIRTRVRFMAVSDSYDRFLTDNIHMKKRKDNKDSDTDFSYLYMRENVYTNIKGGTGIFGTASIQEEYYCMDGRDIEMESAQFVDEFIRYHPFYSVFNDRLYYPDYIIEHLYPKHYYEYKCYCFNSILNFLSAECLDPFHPTVTINPIEGSPWQE